MSTVCGSIMSRSEIKRGMKTLGFQNLNLCHPFLITLQQIKMFFCLKEGNNFIALKD
jgi:hypothetical protein